MTWIWTTISLIIALNAVAIWLLSRRISKLEAGSVPGEYKQDQENIADKLDAMHEDIGAVQSNVEIIMSEMIPLRREKTK